MAGSTTGTPRLRRTRGRRGHTAIGWAFMVPFGVVFLLFTAVPIAASLATSLTDMRSTDLRTPLGVDFVGLQNYRTLLDDGRFLRSVLNTLVFVAAGVPLTMLAGFTLALALDSGIRRFRGMFRGLFYAPVVTNVVSVALIWQYAFNQSGTVNEVLAKIGFAGPNWLGDEHLAMPVVILLGVWRNFGTAMLLFLAGLQAVPGSVVEAAAIDGAGPLRRLRSITLPLLMPTTLLVSVLLSVFFLQVFDEPYLLTGGGHGVGLPNRGRPDSRPQRRGADQADHGEEGAPEKLSAGAADEKVGEPAGDEAGEAHAEHRQHGQPGMFFEIEALDVFHVFGKPTDPETEAIADEETDAGNDPHRPGSEKPFEDAGIVGVAFVTGFAAGFDEGKLGFVDALFLGRLVAKPGEEEEDPDDAQHSRGVKAQSPGRDDGEPVEAGSVAGKVFEGVGFEAFHHAGKNHRRKSAAPARKHPENPAEPGARLHGQPFGLHLGHGGKCAGFADAEDEAIHEE